MASVVSDAGGRKRIQFNDPAGHRKTIRLGKAAKAQADTVKRHIEKLVAAKITGAAPEDDTSRWLATIGDDLHAKLADQGLTAPRERSKPYTVAAFADSYIDERTDIKPNTRAHLLRARNDLVDFLGADRPLTEVTPGDADDWRRWLASPKIESGPTKGGKGLSPNTVRRICGRAKEFFRAAARKKLIAESPFADMKDTNVKENRSRDWFVTRDVAAAVLAACPDAQWRLLFALSRYGGLRCPSEHLELRWGDVDWQRGRITVRSPKTAHHTGHEERVIPLFPELRPYLQAVLDELLEDFDPKVERLSEQPVISRYRQANSNLRTQFNRIIRKAGLTPWPKLFQNLRATRATELAEEFPAHVAATWLGHSNTVADRHYRQTVDDHFNRAAAPQTGHSQHAELGARSGDFGQGRVGGSLLARPATNGRSASVGPQAAQNPAHNTTQYVGTDRNGREQKCENPGDFQNHRDSIVSLAPPVGCEHAAESPKKTRVAQKSGAKSGAIDGDLGALIDVWPALDTETRMTILTTALRAVATGHQPSAQ